MTRRTQLLMLCALTCGCDAKPGADPAVVAKADVKEDKKDAEAAEAGPRPAKPPAPKGKDVQLEKAPEAARKAFWAAVQSGRKQTAAKDYAAAITSFDQALEQLQDHPRALSGRGYARLLAGELDAAEADLRRALAAPGTPRLESAIAFNLGLVAEKRGDPAAARAHFSLANTLSPSKAALAKLAGGTACPLEVRRAEPRGEVLPAWRDVWKTMADEGVLAADAPPADDAAAKRVVCDSEPLTEATRAQPTFDACTGPGPWLIRHDHEWGGHALYVVEPADGGQLRVSQLGIAGGGRCGAHSDAAITGSDPAIVTWNLIEYASIDVMEDKDGGIVDCVDGNPCFTACGDEVDGSASVYIFSSRSPAPTAVLGPLIEQDGASRPLAQVRVEADQIVAQGGGCDLRAPLVAP